MQYIREVDLNNCLKNAVLSKEEVVLISVDQFDCSETETVQILVILEKALKAEEERAKIKHWAYNAVVHKALIAVIREENEILGAVKIAA
jgi:hypothetical protein